MIHLHKYEVPIVILNIWLTDFVPGRLLDINAYPATALSTTSSGKSQPE